jgi:penicillin amidase
VTRRRLFRIGVLGSAGLVAVILVAVLVLGVTVVRRPFPDYSGAIELPGMEGTVTVLRDELGVPQIYADSATDLFRAQGYVHAQDRFFEMDWRRHVTSGRLSELVGENEDALAADKVVRTLGWRRVAEREYANLDAVTRDYLRAYAEGVNDYLAGRSSSQLSVNYTLLGLSVPLPRIEQWDPVDSLTWFKAMAWDLRDNYGDEMDRARIYPGVREIDRVNQLFPAYPYKEHAPILESSARPAAGEGTTDPAAEDEEEPRAESVRAGDQSADTTITDADLRALDDALDGQTAREALDEAGETMDAVPALLGGGVSGGFGSNSWVVSGEHTETGSALLANDPHLSAGIPGLWYQVGLHCTEVSDTCPFDVSGFGFSGVPGVFIGHNQRIAWALTDFPADTTDFFLEKVEGGAYLRDGTMVPLTTRTETIQVAGADPVEITVRSTAHGPILSDVLDSVRSVGERAPTSRGVPERGSGYAVSLAWTALQPGEAMQAVFGIDAATDFASFRAAASKLGAPSQSVLYADVDGHIGYQATGLVPVRATRVPAGSTPVPFDGSWPMPGWDSAFDWDGYVEPAELPYAQDPESGVIVAANQAVTWGGQSPFFTRDWDEGFRSQRIGDLLSERIDSGQKISVSAMQEIQRDTYNPMAAELVPLLLTTDVDVFTEQGRDLLRGWDYTQPTDSAAAVYFNATWAALLDLTFSDELPEGTRPTGGDRWFLVVSNLLENPQDPWWDDRGTPDVVESRDEVIRQAMVQARLSLTSALGKDAQRWEWGQLHQVRLTAVPLGDARSTVPLHFLLNHSPVGLSGGSSIVDATAWDASADSFEVVTVPSMRMVVDLGDLDASRWVNQTGVSGHPGQSHYTDQFDTWVEGGSYPWLFSREAIDRAAENTLTLRPVSS